MKKNINKIVSSLKIIKLNNIEKKRLNKDLSNVYDRIVKREYIQTDFSKDNKFNIPDRTKDFFWYLDSYCKTWKTISKLLNQLSVNKYKNVIDLCSWWAPKVTLWFFYSNYKWNVILLDKDTKSTWKLINFMKLFNPSYKLTRQNIDLFTEFDYKSDFIVWNHVIDDLIISFFSKEHNYKVSNIYESENNLLKCWDNILNSWETFKSKVTNNISTIFDNLLLSNWIIIISQYQSMIEYLLDLKDVTLYNKEVMNWIKEHLMNSWKYEDLSSISYKVLKPNKDAFNASECIILKKK